MYISEYSDNLGTILYKNMSVTYRPAISETIDHNKALLNCQKIQIYEILKIKRKNTMTYNEIINAIASGKIQEDWLTCDSIAVRIALAEHDYKPEVFIHDENYFVVKEVLDQHPEMVTELLGKKDRIKMVGCFLDDQEEIPLDVLKQHLDDVNRYQVHGDTPATELEVKLKALEYEPSLMEVTMTTKQLYESGSPLWAKDMSPRAIFRTISDKRFQQPV